jgi:hypothetical protein
MLVSLAGIHHTVEPGAIVEGAEAARLIAAGFAEPIKEARKATVPLEKAEKKAK